MQVSAAPSVLGGIITVQNMEPNATVFSKQVDGNVVKINFSTHGHPGDTQRVPISLVNDIDFVNAVEGGVLKVVRAPQEVLDALTFETEQRGVERAAEEARASAVIDRRQDRDMVGATCIAPRGANRDGACGQPLVMSASQTAEVPPLCAAHQSLLPQYALIEVGSKGENASETREGIVRREWRPVTLAERRTSGL